MYVTFLFYFFRYAVEMRPHGARRPRPSRRLFAPSRRRVEFPGFPASDEPGRRKSSAGPSVFPAPASRAPGPSPGPQKPRQSGRFWRTCVPMSLRAVPIIPHNILVTPAAAVSFAHYIRKQRGHDYILLYIIFSL